MQVDSKYVSECLAPGDEVDVISFRTDQHTNTYKAAATSNPYGTNMYKQNSQSHFRPPPLPSSPRDREDMLGPQPISQHTTKLNIPYFRV